jgi:hypothetical protein
LLANLGPPLVTAVRITQPNERPSATLNRATGAANNLPDSAETQLTSVTVILICMPVSVVRLVRSRNGAGEVVVRLGVPLLDEYLEFLAGRCPPNTVLAVAYDLKVFFTVAKKAPRRVRPVDVLAFTTAQRSGGEGRLQIADLGGGGVSARTLRRRLSSVPGFYGSCWPAVT